jgi:hypothetical protein
MVKMAKRALRIHRVNAECPQEPHLRWISSPAVSWRLDSSHRPGSATSRYNSPRKMLPGLEFAQAKTIGFYKLPEAGDLGNPVARLRGCCFASPKRGNGPGGSTPQNVQICNLRQVR